MGNSGRLVLFAGLSAGLWVASSAHGSEGFSLGAGAWASAGGTEVVRSSPRDLSATVARALGTVANGAGVGDDTFVKARAGVWFSRASSERSVGDTNVANAINNIDLDDAFGADPDSTQVIASIEVAIPVIDLKIDAGWLGSHELEGGTTTMGGSGVGFDGQVFTGNVQTQDTFELFELNVMYELLELSPTEYLGVKVHVGGGVRFVNYRSEIQGQVSGALTESEESAFVPLPVVGAGGRVDFLKHLYVSSELYYAEYGDFGRVIDINAELGYDFFRNFGVFVGYREIIAETDAFDIDFDVTVEGFYLGGELRL